MAELAAVKGCSLAELSLLDTSDIVLTNESLDALKSHPITQPATLDSTKVHQTPSTAPKYQLLMPWPNQIPQYIYNFPGLVQQLPSYQGYSFPPMQPVLLHYPRNAHKPTNKGWESSSGKKEKSLNGKEDEYSGENGQTESSASNSGSDSGSHKLRCDKNQSPDHSSRRKHRNKSSRTIVIHNIDYITPKRRDGEKCQVSDGSSLDEDEFTQKNSFREKREDAVVSLEECCKLNSSDDKSREMDRECCTANGSEDASQQSFSNDLETCVSKGGKIDDNWEAFQNVLMTNGIASVKGVETYASTPAVDLELEEVLKHQMVSADSFVLKERDEKSENIVKSDDLVNEESFCPLMKSSNCAEEILFNPRSLEESTNELGDTLSTCVKESSKIKCGKGEDWFVVNHSRKQEN
ncbi:hypothetical protein SLEP1_g13498 [Rubroshorea leprosula]|nr:hypothetical protein SLEP1_g13498 [Rubroshorea leprosula]